MKPIFVNLPNTPSVRDRVVRLIYNHCHVRKEQSDFQEDHIGQMELRNISCFVDVTIQDIVDKLNKIEGVTAFVSNTPGGTTDEQTVLTNAAE